MSSKKNNSNDMLSVEEISNLFKIPYITLQRWIYQGKIPYKTVGKDYYFKKSNIYKWAKLHGFEIESKDDSYEKNVTELSLSDSISDGGIYYDIPGENIYKVFENSLSRINFFNEDNKIEILNQLIDREEIASTGIGRGIAIPHIRNMYNLKIDVTKIPIFFLQNDIDFNSIDKKPVFMLFMMFTTSASVHLRMLSKISHLIQDNMFLDNIRENKDKDMLIKKIINFEQTL